MKISLRTRAILWFVGLSVVLLAGFSLALYGETSRSLVAGLDEVLAGEAERLAARVEFEGTEVYVEPTGARRAEEEAGGDGRARWLVGALAFWLEDGRPLDYGQDQENDEEGAAGTAADDSAVASRLSALAEQLSKTYRREGRIDPGTTDIACETRKLRVHWASFRVTAELEDVLTAELEKEGVWPADATEMQEMLEEKADSIELPRVDVLVLAAGSYAPIDERLSGLAVVLLSVVPAALLVAFMFGWFFSGRVAKPVAAIAVAAEQMQAADMSKRLPVSGRGDEIDRLASTLNEAFSRLQGAYSRQTRFTADAAHELRTPLATIRAEAQVALNRERTSDAYREALQGVDCAADRLQRILDGLLLLARSDARVVELRDTDVDLDGLAREVVSELEGKAAARPVELHVQGNGNCLTRGNATLLGMVLRNLIENSLRHTREGGRVDLRLECHPEAVRLIVADDGEGIAPEKLPHVFERFYRADEARTRAKGGAGLGLAVVKTIIELHGGGVAIDSTPGHGTTVTIQLPRAETG